MDLNNAVFFNKTQTVGIIVKNKLDFIKVKTIKIGAGEVVQQLGALATFPEDLCSNHSPHLAALTYL